MKDKFGYYGLRVEPTFDEAVDAVKKPIRIPLPDRAAKRKAFSLFRNAVLDNERMAMGYDPAAPGDDGAPGQTHEQRMDEVLQGAAEHEIRRLEHALGGDSIPASILQVQPSPSADDAVFAEMEEHAKQHYESRQQAAIRHRVDAEAQRMMQGVRSAALHDIHYQGHGHHVLQNEIPLDLLKTEIEQAPGVAGHEQRIEVPRAAPHQMPRATGFPAVREFATFRELNMGHVRETGKRTGHIDFTKQGDSYETFRRATNGAPQNLW